MYRQVKLVRRNGDHIATVVVEAPASAPDILVWNDHYFVRHDRHPALRDEDVYREAMSISVTPIPGIARNDGTEVFPLGPVLREPQQTESDLRTKSNGSAVAKSRHGPVRLRV
jgi:hypothetical protein